MTDSSAASGGTLRVVLQMLTVAVVAAGVGWFVGQQPVSPLKAELMSAAVKGKIDADKLGEQLAAKDRQNNIQQAALQVCGAVGELDAANYGNAQKAVDAAKGRLSSVTASDGVTALVTKVAGVKIDPAGEADAQRAVLISLSKSIGAEALK